MQEEHPENPCERFQRLRQLHDAALAARVTTDGDSSVVMHDIDQIRISMEQAQRECAAWQRRRKPNLGVLQFGRFC